MCMTPPPPKDPMDVVLENPQQNPSLEDPEDLMERLAMLLAAQGRGVTLNRLVARPRSGKTGKWNQLRVYDTPQSVGGPRPGGGDTPGNSQ